MEEMDLATVDQCAERCTAIGCSLFDLRLLRPLERYDIESRQCDGPDETARKRAIRADLCRLPGIVRSESFLSRRSVEYMQLAGGFSQCTRYTVAGTKEPASASGVDYACATKRVEPGAHKCSLQAGYLGIRGDNASVTCYERTDVDGWRRAVDQTPDGNLDLCVTIRTGNAALRCSDATPEPFAVAGSFNDHVEEVCSGDDDIEFVLDATASECVGDAPRLSALFDRLAFPAYDASTKSTATKWPIEPVASGTPAYLKEGRCWDRRPLKCLP